jgi:hypothetical protein
MKRRLDFGRLRLDERLCEQLRLHDRLPDWLNSPAERALRQTAQRFATPEGEAETPPEHPPAPANWKRRRKPGGGSKKHLTPEQIAHGREVYGRELDKDHLLVKHSAAAAHLDPLLEYNVTHRRLIEDIIIPVLQERSHVAHVVTPEISSQSPK